MAAFQTMASADDTQDLQSRNPSLAACKCITAVPSLIDATAVIKHIGVEQVLGAGALRSANWGSFVGIFLFFFPRAFRHNVDFFRKLG
jgi:hypothetical protein